MELKIIPFPAFFPRHQSGTDAYLRLDSGDEIRLVGVKNPTHKELDFTVRLDVGENGELVITCFEPVKIINQFEEKKK